MSVVVRSPSRLPGPTFARPSGTLRVRRRISHLLGSVPPSASFRVFQRTAPLSTSQPVSTPGEVQVAPPFTFGKSLPATRSFRPRGLSPPRRLSPPTARGLVASHSRSWGSSGFNLVPHHRNGAPHAVSPPMPYPSELSPPAKPYLHFCRPLPSCRFELRSWGHQGSSTSRLCSVRASVVAASRCRSTTPVALLGFPVSGASPSSSHHADRRPRSSTALPSRPSRGERERPPPGITGVRRRPKATPREADARDCGRVGLPASPQPANRSGAGPRSVCPTCPHRWESPRCAPDAAFMPVRGDEDQRAPWTPKDRADGGLREVEAKGCFGTGSEAFPALNPLRGRRTLRRSPLASGRPVVRAAGCAPAGRPPLRTRGQAGSHIAGSPRRHTPVPWTPWSPRCRDAVAACSPSGVLRWHHRGRLLHTCAPSRGRHRPALSGRPAGSVAQMRPHRPQHTPAASPWWPTRAAPCANRSRCSEVSTHRRYRARVKRHSAPPAPCSRRPHGRTFDRRAHVHPRVAFRCAGMFACTWAEALASRHPQATRGREAWPSPRRCRRDGLSLTCLISRTYARKHRTRCLHHLPASDRRVICPRAAIRRVAPGDGKGTHRPAPPHRRVPAPRTAMTKGGGCLRGSCCRAGRRRDRHGLGRPSSRGLPSSPVAASARRRPRVVQGGGTSPPGRRVRQRDSRGSAVFPSPCGDGRSNGSTSGGSSPSCCPLVFVADSRQRLARRTCSRN